MCDGEDVRHHIMIMKVVVEVLIAHTPGTSLLYSRTWSSITTLVIMLVKSLLELFFCRTSSSVLALRTDFGFQF